MAGRKDESESEEEEAPRQSNEGSHPKSVVPLLTFLNPKEVSRKLEKEEVLVDAPTEIVKGIANRILP